MDDDDDRNQYFAVTNIPSQFHAADLRAHFSSLVESSSFICFHFRHRPEKVSTNTEDTITNKGDRKLCCVVKIVKEKLDEFLRYNEQSWTTVNGDFLADKCQLAQIQLTSIGRSDDDLDAVDKDKLLQMPELKPPDLMPQGNVGTPTLVFLDLIQRCLLPHNLINKLQLKFPKTAGRRLYANVDFNYGSSGSREQTHNVGEERNVDTYSRHNILIRRPHVKHKVPCELDKDIDHQLVAADSLHMCHVQRLSSEKVLLGGDRAQESRNEKVMEDVIREQESRSEKVMEDVIREQESRNEKVMEDVIREQESRNEKVAVNINTVQSSSSEKVMETTDYSSVNFEEPQKFAIDTDRLQSVLPQSSVVSVIRSCQGLSSTPGQSGSSNAFVKPTAPPGKEARMLTNRERKIIKKQEQFNIKQLKAENIEERLIAVEKRYHNDDDAEEWDRHEASEDDPSNQERNKERLYEEEIEQPWEKGGPGVVFYTDAVFWQEREGDFDEQTTDDLDVDFSVYEGDGAGDKDIQDFLKIRQERRYREGYDDTDRFSAGIGKRLPQSTSTRRISRVGTFESHSKGIGRKVMERQGWREGQGLGRSMPGIVNALKGEGQGPRSKRGLGYTELKPVTYGSNVWKRPRDQSHFITTIFDDPKTTDPKEPLLHRSEPSTLKHRQSHLDRFT